MNSILWWLVQNSISIALAVPVVWVACRLFRNRPAAQHLLWLVVLVKFATPSLVVWPWSLPGLVEPRTESVTPTSDGIQRVDRPETPRTARKHAAPRSVAKLANRPSSRTTSGPGRMKSPLTFRSTATWRTVLSPRQAAPMAAGAVWLTGCVVCCWLQLRKIRRQARVVRLGEPASDELKREVAVAAKQFGCRSPRILVAPAILSPFIWCLGRLRLVWPAALAEHSQVARSRGIIAHELAHVRRGDAIVAWLELATSIVWWWNPLFWLVRKRLRETAEMACDALALHACQQNRRAYAEQLLELSTNFQSLAPMHALRASAGTPAAFERRLAMIMSDSVSGRIPKYGLLLALVMLLFALPGWTVGQQTSPSDAKTTDYVPPSRTDIASADGGVDTTQAADRDGTAERVLTDGATDDALQDKIAKLQAEIDRLNLLLEDARRIGVTGSAEVSETEPEQTEILGEEEPSPTRIVFKSNRWSYTLTCDRNGATLQARNQHGKVMWRCQLMSAEEAQSAERQWSLVVPSDVKQVVVTGKQAGAGSSVRFHLDTDSGKVLMKTLVGAGTASDAAEGESATEAFHAGPILDTPTEQGKWKGPIRGGRTGKLLLEGESRENTPSQEELDAARAQAESDQQGFPGTETSLNADAAEENRFMESDRDSGISQEYSPLDLAERYLKADADLQRAESRWSRFEKAADSIPSGELDEARIELARARKQLILVTSFVKDAVAAVEDDILARREECIHVEELSAKGFASDTQAKRARSRLQRAESKLRRLTSILSVVSESAEAPVSNP